MESPQNQNSSSPFAHSTLWIVHFCEEIAPVFEVNVLVYEEKAPVCEANALVLDHGIVAGRADIGSDLPVVSWLKKGVGTDFGTFANMLEVYQAIKGSFSRLLDSIDIFGSECYHQSEFATLHDKMADKGATLEDI